MVWFIFEAAITALGTYRLLHGFYTVYRDVETVREQYVETTKITNEYKRVQRDECLDPLTESQYHRYEDEFVII